MIVLELIRMEESEQGTLGVLKVDKEVFCFTIEPPDRLNERNRSSIPAQQYTVKPYSSAKYPDVFQVVDVPGRDHVLFHKGNTVDHTAGCVLLGSSVGKLKGNRAVLNSGATFDAFRKRIGDEPAHLTIKEEY